MVSLVMPTMMLRLKNGQKRIETLAFFQNGIVMMARSGIAPPSMIALRCFAAAARSGSFTRAAGELNLTQSAVSRQIAKLEGQLGVRLFTRTGPYLQLTERGQAYASAVTPPLAAIVAATERFRSGLDTGIITVATLPSFGMRWLAPRLSRLTRELPELVVNLLARSDEFDFAAEVHDAAIHFGHPDWPGVRCDRLFGEVSVAVASPGVLASAPGSLHTLLTQTPLLALSNRPDAWAQWASEAGIAIDLCKPLARYDHFAMLTQAAAAGAGAALLPQFLIEEELRDGRLVALSSVMLASSGAYYLVYPEERMEKTAFRKFRAWLIAEANGVLAESGRPTLT